MRSERVNVCRSVLFCVHAAILFVWMCKETETEKEKGRERMSERERGRERKGERE